MRSFVAAVSVAVVALAVTTVVGCSDDDPEVTGAAEEVGPTFPGATEIEVEANDFSFVPDTLSLTAGEPVNLTMRVTVGGHNLRVEGTGFQFPVVEAGRSVLAGLSIAEPGDYRMVCTVPGHEAAGMVGTVTVT